MDAPVNQKLLVKIRLEDGSYWATIDAFPGLFAAGDTIGELQSSLEEAIALYLSTPEREVTSVQLAALEPPVVETTTSAELVFA